jgi:hypothetical protein
MDSLPDWALWIITAAVGAAPGMAIFSARRVARLLHRALWPRSEVAPGRHCVGSASEGSSAGVRFSICSPPIYGLFAKDLDAGSSRTGII